MVDFMIPKIILNGSYASQSKIPLTSVSARVENDEIYYKQLVQMG